jgi:GAF domain-containing protein
LANATRLCGAKFGTLYLREGNAFRAAAFHNAPPAFIEDRKNRLIEPASGTTLGRAAKTKQVAQILDSTKREAYRQGDPFVVAGADLGGYRTIVSVPMLKEDELLGVISIYRQEVLAFSDKQIELVSNFAAQAVIALENTRLLNELRESLQQQTATADVLKVISRSTFDLQTVLNTLVESATRLCDSDHAWLFECDGEILRWRASYGHETEVHEKIRKFFINKKIPVDRGSVVGRTAKEGSLVHIHDVLADPEYTWGEAQKIGGYRAALGVPLLRAGNIAGVFFIAKTVPQAFTEKQIELATTFADQAVIAIENTRLFGELQNRTDDLTESLQQQTATSDVLRVISRSPTNIQPVLDAILETAGRLCESEYALFFRLHDSKYHLAGSNNAKADYIKYLYEHPISVDRGTVIGRTAVERRVVHIPDCLADPEYTAHEYARTGKHRSMLGVPLLRDGVPVGVIGLLRTSVKPYTDKQIELVTTFADQAVIAIENVRLFDEVQTRTRDLSESLQQQTATAEVLKVISASPGELEPVFSAMLENAIRICEAKFGVLFRYENGAFHPPAASVGVPAVLADFYQQRGAFEPPAGSPLDRLLQVGSAVYTADEAAEPSPGSPARLGGARSLVAVPMLKENKLIGAIVIYRQEVRPFTEKQIELVTNFGAQAVIAIENVRLLNELRESLQRQTATADVLKVISRSTFDLQTVLDTLVESASRLCEADMASINREMDGVFRQAASYGFTAEMQAYMSTHPIAAGQGSIVGRAVMRGATIHIPDVLADPEYKMTEAASIGGVHTMLGVPLLREGTPIGVILLQRKAVRPFTDKQVELVETFADQAVIAIENVRLFNSVETRTRELAASLENLRTAQDRLVQTEKLASLGQLTAGIAHEIKNPLNFVNNFSGISAELIDELQETLGGISIDKKTRAEITELTDTLRGNLEKVVQHGKRADSIVKNMLLHSRSGSGDHRPVEINAVVEESLNLAYHGARAEKQGFNITLERSFDPAAGEVDVFPQEITRVLLNLISNGFYAATKRKGQSGADGYEPTLAAATKDLGDRVEIRIRDNGTGIPPDVKDKMFNPFFTTKPAGEGTGLGLSISHDIIVKQHAGSIEVDTRPGEFTEFRIILPRAAASLAKSGA